MTQPDVVLVGDSVRLSYEPHVSAALTDRQVWGPAENCQSTQFLQANLERLVLSRLDSYSIVHLNAGAHDLRRWPEGGYAVQVELDDYATHLTSIVQRLAAHDRVVEVVLATTTPVIDERHESGRLGRRLNADVIAYNERLVSVAGDWGVRSDDLYGVVKLCRFDVILEDGIHLTNRGAEHVGRAVARFLTAPEVD